MNILIRICYCLGVILLSVSLIVYVSFTAMVGDLIINDVFPISQHLSEEAQDPFVVMAMLLATFGAAIVMEFAHFSLIAIGVAILLMIPAAASRKPELSSTAMLLMGVGVLASTAFPALILISTIFN